MKIDLETVKGRAIYLLTPIVIVYLVAIVIVITESSAVWAHVLFWTTLSLVFRNTWKVCFHDWSADDWK